MKTFLLPLLFSPLFAAIPAPIGIVTASGHFNLEGSEVWGNATLFDGATLETGSASSELALRNGVKVQLGAASRARVWRDRLILEKGVGQAASPATFSVSAGGLNISADAARIRVDLDQRVEIAVYSGSARVAGSSGVILAAIPAGRSMIFAMQAGPVTHTGCMVYRDGRFLLQDQNTQEVIELNGNDLAANVGNRVEVTGAASSAKPVVSVATSVLNVASVAARAQGGCLSVAAALGARTDVPAAAPTPTQAGQPPSSTPAPKAAGGGGLSGGAKAAIIIGVAGGAGAGVYVATHKSSTSP